MPLARAYKTSGLVLRARNLGEADKILTLFTADRGKIDAVAKGVRRQKSALGGRLEFMSEAQLSLHRGRNLDVITAAEIIHSHFDAIVRPDAFAAAGLMAELVDAFCEPDLPLPDIYALLTGALTSFPRLENPLDLMPRFQLRLLDALGLAPPCDHCVRCGETLVERSAWVDVDSGGLAGTECHASWMHVLELDETDVRNFRALAAPKGTHAATVRASAQAQRAVEAFVSYHLGRRPKAAAY